MPRYMILIKASPEAENPISTGPEIFEEMTTFNEELHAAGVMASVQPKMATVLHTPWMVLRRSPRGLLTL